MPLFVVQHELPGVKPFVFFDDPFGFFSVFRLLCISSWSVKEFVDA